MFFLYFLFIILEKISQSRNKTTKQKNKQQAPRSKTVLLFQNCVLITTKECYSTTLHYNLSSSNRSRACLSTLIHRWKGESHRILLCVSFHNHQCCPLVGLWYPSPSFFVTSVNRLTFRAPVKSIKKTNQSHWLKIEWDISIGSDFLYF